ncbi:MAG TPA: menaquinone biosynthesis protein [Chitinophagaceae bacterium]|nr:menaquinone biosynthesis protein [Chitinophagaceae bacterium]
MNKKIKVGSVSYLNTRPLVYGLKLPPINEEIELVEETPARLAELLMNDDIDVGLIPVAIIPQLKQYFIVSDYCIGTESEVASVCLFSEVPLEEIQKVYLDYQSRSSVALLKWLMKEYWGIHPQIEQAKDDSYRKEIKGTTAGLVIGDRAFEQRKISTFIYDLASEWRSITGLPFVFAAWISNKPLPEAFIQKFNEANAMGLNHLDEIAKTQQFDLFDLKKYYSLHMSYKLDERKKKGMELFLQYIKLYPFLQ